MSAHVFLGRGLCRSGADFFSLHVQMEMILRHYQQEADVKSCCSAADCDCSMNAPVMVALDGETDPLEVRFRGWVLLLLPCQRAPAARQAAADDGEEHVQPALSLQYYQCVPAT
jgi:hypothetical protein